MALSYHCIIASMYASYYDTHWAKKHYPPAIHRAIHL